MLHSCKSRRLTPAQKNSKNIPPNARWTKISRDIVNPETDKHDHYLVRHQKCMNPEKAEEEPRGSHLFGIHALGVCRQIHSEARLIYSAAYQHFWRETNFVLRLDFPVEQGASLQYCGDICDWVQRLYEQDVNQIQHLRIAHPGFEWKLDGNLWIENFDRGEEYMLFPAVYRTALEGAGYHVAAVGSEALLGVCMNWPGYVGPEPAKKLLAGRQISKQEIASLLWMAKELVFAD